jgi:hypothetical protein
VITSSVTRTGIYRFTPHSSIDLALINCYLDKFVTIRSTCQDIGSDVVISRRAFIKELKRLIEYYVGRPVAPHIFGGAAAELLGGPCASDMDIRISRTTFHKINIADVGAIVLDCVAKILLYNAKQSEEFSNSSEEVARAYKVKIFPHGDTTLIKIGDQIDISVASFFGTELLSPAGVDGFSYDCARNRFSCVAGTIWCNRALFLLNLKRMHDREFIAACPIKTHALFNRLVHERAHAYSVKASDVAVAKRRFRETKESEADKEIWQGLQHFRIPKERMIELMIALSFLKKDAPLVKKYASGWVKARTIGMGSEIFLGELVKEIPHIATSVLHYLYGFILLEFAFSQKQTIGAHEFLISGQRLKRPMFSLRVGERERYIPLRDDNDPFPTPIQIINDFIKARDELLNHKVNLDSFKVVLNAFEFESQNLNEDELWSRVVLLWRSPKIQTLQHSLNPQESPKELVHGLLNVHRSHKLQYLICDTLANLELISKVAEAPDKLVAETFSPPSITLLTDKMSHLSLSAHDPDEPQPKEEEVLPKASTASFACEYISPEAVQVQRDLAMREYLKTTVKYLQDETGACAFLKREFTLLWKTLEPHIQSEEERQLATRCIVALYANSKDKADLQLGMNRCIQDVMQGSDVAIQFLDALTVIPNEHFEDADFLQDVETLVRVACRRHLCQSDDSLKGVAEKLCSFLYSLFADKKELKVSQRIYEFIKKQFYFVIEQLDQAKDRPLNIELLHLLVKTLSLIGVRFHDFESVNRCFFISKRYTPSHHTNHAESMRSFALTNLEQLPRGVNSESQEGCFKLLISLFSLFNELAPEQLIECVKKLKTCHFNAKTLPLFFEILHLAFDAFKSNPKQIVELIVKNIEVSLLFPLRDAVESAVCLLEKLHALAPMWHIVDAQRVVQIHVSLSRHLLYAALKRDSFEGEGLLDRYIKSAFLTFRDQLTESFKKDKAFFDPLYKLNLRLKQFGWLLSFMPHWFRFFCLVDSEIVKSQQRSLFSYEKEKQVPLLNAHGHLMPAELTCHSEQFLQELLVMGLTALRGLTQDEMCEFQRKANSTKLLNQSLRLLQVAFESQVNALHMEQKPKKVKNEDDKQIKKQWQYIFGTLEQTFGRVFSNDERLKNTLIQLKAQVATERKY